MHYFKLKTAKTHKVRLAAGLRPDPLGEPTGREGRGRGKGRKTKGKGGKRTSKKGNVKGGKGG